MCMDSWAEREIEILKSKNKPESDEEFDYVGECAESADVDWNLFKISVFEIFKKIRLAFCRILL